MTYDPKTHLLRPLEPGEIIEATDLFVCYARLVPAENTVGNTWKPVGYVPHFRPVPITIGWRPRSEMLLIQEAPKGSEVAWKGPALTETFPINVTPGLVWTHFYIIPPCDLPPPDPERERFDRWWKLAAPENMNATDDKETAYCIWLAARREAP